MKDAIQAFNIATQPASGRRNVLATVWSSVYDVLSGEASKKPGRRRRLR